MLAVNQIDVVQEQASTVQVTTAPQHPHGPMSELELSEQAYKVICSCCDL